MGTRNDGAEGADTDQAPPPRPRPLRAAGRAYDRRAVARRGAGGRPATDPDDEARAAARVAAGADPELGRRPPLRWPAPGPRRRAPGHPGPARRAADARLPDDPGDRRAQRRTLAAEPRLGVPDAAGARGRGPGASHPGPTTSGCTSSPTPDASAVEALGERAQAPWDLGGDDAVGARDLAEQMGQLAGAFKQVLRTGSAGQHARARTVLSDARRALYQILADDDAEAPDPADRHAHIDTRRHLRTDRYTGAASFAVRRERSAVQSEGLGDRELSHPELGHHRRQPLGPHHGRDGDRLVEARALDGHAHELDRVVRRAHVARTARPSRTGRERDRRRTRSAPRAGTAGGCLRPPAPDRPSGWRLGPGRRGRRRRAARCRPRDPDRPRWRDRARPAPRRRRPSAPRRCSRLRRGTVDPPWPVKSRAWTGPGHDVELAGHRGRASARPGRAASGAGDPSPGAQVVQRQIGHGRGAASSPAGSREEVEHEVGDQLGAARCARSGRRPRAGRSARPAGR